MIKDKINPELRKRFLQEIKKSKETGVERGFHICIEEDGKLSAGDTCVGDECSLKFPHVNVSCPGKKAQGDFHTHPYLAQVKKEFGLSRMKVSDQLIRSATDIFLKERETTPTMPTQGDAISAILGKCSKRINGTTCVGSDLDESKVECWTVKDDINDEDCLIALMEQMSPEETGSKPPKGWVIPLFDKEMINLKKVRKGCHDKR